jgi:hypothetical protein
VIPAVAADLRRRVWRTVRIGAGSALLVVGIVGLALPVIQGIALIVAGLTLLATEVPWARRLLQALQRRLRPRRAATANGSLAPTPKAGREGGDARGDGQAG